MARSQITDAGRSGSKAFDCSVLNWMSFDRTKIVTSIVDVMLGPWAADHKINLRYRPTDGAPSQSISGLNIWAAWEPSDLETICLSIAKHRCWENSSAIHIVYADRRLWNSRSTFAQSGAHAVVQRLTLLPQAIESIGPHIPLSRETGSPLTQGLIERLPWSDPLA